MTKLLVHPPEWIDAAPTVAESSIVIDAPAATVWKHIADHESWPTWFRSLKKVEVSGSREGIGSTRRVRLGFFTIDEEFTAWDVDEHFAFAVTKAPVPILKALIESVRIDANGDDQCTVTYRQGLQGRRGWGSLVKQAGKQMRKKTTSALAELKALAETN